MLKVVRADHTILAILYGCTSSFYQRKLADRYFALEPDAGSEVVDCTLKPLDSAGNVVDISHRDKKIIPSIACVQPANEAGVAKVAKESQVTFLPLLLIQTSELLRKAVAATFSSQQYRCCCDINAIARASRKSSLASVALMAFPSRKELLKSKPLRETLVRFAP